MRGNTSWQAVLGLSVVTACFLFSAGPANAVLLVYEPFDYGDDWLDGKGGALGTVGTWESNDTGLPDGWRVHPQGQLTGVAVDVYVPPTGGLNMFDGTMANLPTSGGFAGMAGPEDRGMDYGTDGGTGNLDASIGLDPSVTATFQSNTTTWFSFVSVHAWDRNQGAPQFMIGTDTTTAGSRGLTMVHDPDLGQIGNGIGGGGGAPRGNLFYIYPQYFESGLDNHAPGGYVGDVLGLHDGLQVGYVGTGATGDGTLDNSQRMSWVSTDADGFGAANIVVGKIEWDADTGGEDIISLVRFRETETLSEEAFDALIAAQPDLSSRNWQAGAWGGSNKPNLDQSQFDTLNFSMLKFFIDEIRIATTFQEVIGLSLGTPGDTNDDGVVDAADFIILKKNFGGGAGGDATVGNFDGLGTVDWADLSTLMTQMGAGSAAPATTPEPGTLGLLAIGAAAVIRRRRS